MDAIKVIFLDIDGVLNDNHTKSTTGMGFKFIDTSKILRLKSIVAATGAKIVLSSDWRYDREDPLLNGDFLELRERLAKHGLTFYDFTPEIDWDSRGLEIQTWLDAHPQVSRFVILDDRDDMEPNMGHLIQTTMRHGLTERLAERAIAFLNGP